MVEGRPEFSRAAAEVALFIRVATASVMRLSSDSARERRAGLSG